MYQAGIDTIELIEDKGIAFTFYSQENVNAITALLSTGARLKIENNQQPEFDIKIKFSKGGNLTQDFSLKFFILGMDIDNLSIIRQLVSSIYGWCMLVKYYDGSFKFYRAPLFCDSGDIKPQSEMSYAISMGTATPTTGNYFDYLENVAAKTYRFDTLELTWDSEIYSFDYEL